MSTEDLLKKAEEYRTYAGKKAVCHYRMSEAAKARHARLGIPVTVASTVVGTTIFATLNSPERDLRIQIGAGLVSLLAAVLSSLQTFFNYSEVSGQHKEAAAEYESVRRELDAFILANSSGEAALKALRQISMRMDDLARKAPSIPDRVYDGVREGAIKPTS